MSMINFIVAHLHQVLWMSCSMIYLTCIKLSVILRLVKKNYAITRLVILMKMIYRNDMSKIYADASYDHHFTAYHMQGEKHLSLRPDQSTLQPYKPSGPLRQACKRPVSKKTKKNICRWHSSHTSTGSDHISGPGILIKTDSRYPSYLPYQGFQCSTAKLGRASPNLLLRQRTTPDPKQTT